MTTDVLEALRHIRDEIYSQTANPVPDRLSADVSIIRIGRLVDVGKFLRDQADTITNLQKQLKELKEANGKLAALCTPRELESANEPD